MSYIYPLNRTDCFCSTELCSCRSERGRRLSWFRRVSGGEKKKGKGERQSNVFTDMSSLCNVYNIIYTQSPDHEAPFLANCKI